MTNAEQATIKQESILIADCGNTNTTVALFDVAGGSYRFIARSSVTTTAAPPYSDITKGIHQAINNISDITGRTLLNERDMLIKPSSPLGTGVDHFAAIISAAPPLSTLLVGLFDDVSMASARRALNRGYNIEVDSFSLADGRNEQAQVATIIEKKPDLIFLVGGTDGGAEQRLMQLVETVSLGVGVLEDIKLPQVLFAGNKNMREQVRRSLGETTTVHVANNVRPDLDMEHLEHASKIVGELYENIKMNALPGIQQVREWSSLPLMPTAQAFATITEYFAALQKARVIGVDMGSNNITLVVADPVRTNLSVRTDLGMGRPIANLLTEVDQSAIHRWVPSEITDGEVIDYIHNKRLFPHTVPMTETEMFLEHAAAREALLNVVTKAIADWGWSSSGLPPFRLLLARGNVLTNTPRPGQALLMLLDALQPSGLFSVALDKHGVLPALGSLAAHDPLATVQVLEGGVLEDLGWVVAPVGKGQPGQKVLTVVMQSEQAKQLEIEVEYGTIEVLPLAPGQSAEINLRPERRFDIGFGPGQAKQVTLQGGSVGLVVDARGRPLELPEEDDAKRQLIRQWHWDVGG